MQGADVVGRSLPNGEVCFLFTDVESSTSILREVGDVAWAHLQDRMHGVVRDAVQAHGGTVVNTEGDGCFAAFDTARAAAMACAQAQAALRGADWRPAREVRVRMGLHLGTGIQPVGGDYVAMAVHRTARISDAAHGGQVLATSEVVDRSSTPELFVDLGLFSVRDFDGPVRLFAMASPGFPPVPPRVPPAFDHQVPRFRGAMVGRDAEITMLLEQLELHPVVTITGPAGIGKTRLAVAVLAQLSTELAAGPWFVDLARVYGPNSIGDALALAVGCPPEIEVDAHLDAQLNERRGVLVLDHCDDVPEAAAAAATLLRDWNPTLQILATARHALGLVTETVLELGPLGQPDAPNPASVLTSEGGRLFLERASRALSDHELSDAQARAIFDVCRAVDAVPLSLELAAAMVGEDTLGGLTRTIAQQPTALAVLIERAFTAAGERPRRAAAAISVLRPPIAPALAHAAVAALDVDVSEIAVVLDDLVEQSLLDVDGDGDYVQLAPVRVRAEGLLSPSDRAAVLRALLAQCLAVTADAPVPLSRHEHLAAAATALVFEDELPVRDRQRLATQLSPWWCGRLGARRAREHLNHALSLGRAGAATAALHLAIVDTYAAGAQTLETESHIYEAARLLGEHDTPGPDLIARLRDAATRASHTRAGQDPG